MSAFANPIILSQEGPAQILERIPLSANDSAFSEKWLQEALFAHPHCLPIKELDPRMGRLIPICMELQTEAGPADILYITENGQLVVVETKLWRNPEARRVVVAQILDYAKQLTKWSYSDLAKLTAMTTKQGPSYLLDCVRKVSPNIDEADFVDSVTNSLKSGDFLLLIVGDGIRTGTESLVNFIDLYGNLRFGLGLVEVAAFKLPNNDILLQPRILAKTEVLQRTVLVGANSPAAEFEHIAAAEDSDEKNNTQRQWYQEFWKEYFNILKLDDVDQPIPSTPPKSTNVYFMMPVGANNAWVSAYVAPSSKIGGVYLTFTKSYEKAQEIFNRLLLDREEIEKSIGVPLNWGNDGQKIFISVPTVGFNDLNNLIDRKKVQKYLSEMSNNMINAFRNRLELLSKEI